MKSYIVLVDCSNENQVISKDHGNMVKVGEVLQFDETPASVDRLVEIGVIKEFDPEPAAQDPSLADMTKAELTVLAQAKGIEIPNKATKAEILDLLK